MRFHSFSSRDNGVEDLLDNTSKNPLFQPENSLPGILTGGLDSGMLRRSLFQEPADRNCREIIREPAAEFLGTFVLMIFGCGVNCQVVLSGNSAVTTFSKVSHSAVVLSLL